MNVRLLVCAAVFLTTCPLPAAPLYRQTATRSTTNSKSSLFDGNLGYSNGTDTSITDTRGNRGGPNFFSPTEAKSDDEVASQSVLAADFFEWQGHAYAAGNSTQNTKGTYWDRRWGDASSAFEVTFDLAEPTEYQVRWDTFGEVIRAVMSDSTFAKASLNITMDNVSELSLLHTDADLNRVVTQNLLLPTGTHKLSVKVEGVANVYFPPFPETYSADVTAKLNLTPVPEPSTSPSQALAPSDAWSSLAVDARGNFSLPYAPAQLSSQTSAASCRPRRKHRPNRDLRGHAASNGRTRPRGRARARQEPERLAGQRRLSASGHRQA